MSRRGRGAGLGGPGSSGAPTSTPESAAGPAGFVLAVDSPAYGPFAAGRREDGKVVLVDHAVPGDLVEAEPYHETSSLVNARITRVVEPSPHRREPLCPSFPACGGCSWMNYIREAQLRYKAEVVNRLLSRLRPQGTRPDRMADGRWSTVDGSPTGEGKPAPHGSPDPPLPGHLLSEILHDALELGYRHRVRLHLSGRPGVPCSIGFFSHGTHDVVPIRSCPVCVPELDRAVAALAGWPPPVPFSASVELVATADGAVLGVLYLSQPIRRPAGLARRLVEDGLLAGAVVASPESGWGRFGVQSGRIRVSGREAEAGLDVEEPIFVPVSATSFCQANRTVNRLLVRHVVDTVRQTGASRVLELYAGHGNFTYPLAHAGTEVVAVEVGVDLSILPPHPRVRFIRGDAVGQLRKLGRAPLVLLDPPRTGARELMPHLAKAGPGHILYVSCDPNTFVRDAAVLSEGGYRIASITAFDMMPQTHHVELTALFQAD